MKTRCKYNKQDMSQPNRQLFLSPMIFKQRDSRLSVKTLNQNLTLYIHIQENHFNITKILGMNLRTCLDKSPGIRNAFTKERLTVKRTRTWHKRKSLKSFTKIKT